MPAIAAKTSIAATTAAVQAAACFDFIETQLLAAGFTVLRYLSGHGTGSARAAIYRWPSFDGDRHSLSDMLFISTRTTTGSLYIADCAWDLDIQQSSAVAYNTIQGSEGGWTAGTYPTTGNPYVWGFGAGGTVFSQHTFDGLAYDPIRCVVSEYGLFVHLHRAAGTDYLIWTEREAANSHRYAREIEVVGTATGVAPGWPITFAAPSGAAHLTVNIEGVSKNVTFPTATPLSAFRVAQHITMSLGGWGEAYVRTPSSGNDRIVIRIPPDRPPSGNYSTTAPQISLTYQDPQVLAAGLSFELYNGTVTAITTGAAGTVQRNGSQWPLDNGGVRIGATVYNHTRGNSCLVTGFSTTTTQDDTLVCDTVPGTWVPADTIEVLPGPNNHQHGIGQHGGSYQCCLDSDPLANIEDGANRVVVLNDELGEAQDHYEVGQSVMLANNGLAHQLTITPVSGTLLRGEIVEVTTGTSDGARGVIRAKVSNEIIVDTIRGPADIGSPYTLPPWTNGDTITGQTSGATATIATNAHSGIGWFCQVAILAIGQKDVPNGDYRTTLTLDLGAGHINSNFSVAPGAVIGCMVKQRWGGSYNAPLASEAPSCMPVVEINPTQQNYWDPARGENAVFAAADRPIFEPDRETHSLMMGATGRGRTTGSVGIGADPSFSSMHFRTVCARQYFGSLAITDQFDEDGDSNRAWALMPAATVDAFGAHSTASATHYYIIGPGDSSFI